MTAIRRAASALAVVILAAACSKHGAPATTATHDPLVLHDCRIDAAPGPARCGTFTVPENRDDPNGRRLALNLIVLPASGSDAAPDPIVLLTGGPGLGAATEAGVAGMLDAARAHRAVILLDQRGTGASAPLACTLYGDADHLQPYVESMLPPDRVRTCRRELETKADLARYTTPVAMDDLDDLRAALGYDQIDLFGLSYGAKAALVYLRQHPTHVRSAVLMGVVTTSYPTPLPAAVAGDSALRRLAADCDTDTVCVRAFPRLLTVFDELRARLDASPARVAVGRGDTVVLTSRAVTEGVWYRLYDRSDAAAIPLLIHRLWSGDLRAFRAEAEATRARRHRFAAGALLSIVCAEDVPTYTDADVARAAASSIVGAPLARDIRDACAEWPRAPLPADYHEPVRSDVPVLLLSGANDPIAPPIWAEQALRTLSHGTHIIRPLAGHIDPDDCALPLVAAFFERPDGAALDRSCLERQRRPPFILMR